MSFKEEEINYRNFLDNTNDLVQSVDAKGNFIFVNKKWLKVLGYSKKEAEKLNLFKIIRKDQIKHCAEAFKRVCSGKKIDSVETVFVSKKGKEIIVEGSVGAQFKNGKFFATVGIFRDITSRKEMEERLSQSEEKYRKIFDLSPEAIIVLDRKGKMIELNNRIHDWLGYKKEEVAGKGFIQMPYMTAKSKAAVLRNFLERMAGKKIQPYELEFLDKKGKKYIGLVDAAPVRDKNGKFLQDIVMITNITERKMAEKELQKGQERYRMLVENLNEGIWQIDKKGYTVFVNLKMAQVLGYAAKGMVGKHLFDFMDEQGVRLAKYNMKRREQGISEQHDFEFVCKNGKKIFTTLETSPITDEKGNYAGAIAGVIDITRRKIAENELRFKNTLLSTQQETSMDGILVVDENGKILSFNKRFVKMWGITQEVIEKKSDKLALKSVLSNLSKPEEFLDKVKYLYEHKEETSMDEISLKDGRVFDRYSSPVAGSDGKYYGRIWYFRDISERKRVEKMKTDFISLTSHQLKTPLTTIRWLAELLSDEKFGSLSKDQKEYINDIHESTMRTIRLVNDLLNVSRLEEGRLAIDPKPLQLEDIVKDVIEKLDIFRKIKYCQVKFIAPKEKLPLIPLDDTLIRQILINLLSNAIRYSKPREGRVIIKTEKRNKDYLLTVADNGIGIPLEDQSRIFERFFRSENARRAETDGSGLGLYLVRLIAKSVGGDVWFKSSEGKGTTFYVSIPLAGMKEAKGDRSLLTQDII